MFSSDLLSMVWLYFKIIASNSEFALTIEISLLFLWRKKLTCVPSNAPNTVLNNAYINFQLWGKQNNTQKTPKVNIS